ncbi:2'-5' RNA ligase family protein [Streptomyces sp. CBMA123]|uniref:2'-5' RNA ligase family protein n=1 Tax=Streptomyces sp. CBMA123 TaxID=1896313 RepID=UPI001661B2EC|nr:hypothetical protein [Streptomyces sp. CBMA123]MBD0688407.1 hypothetical protein [Streptomyces sp. CBMA123]
MDNFFNPSRIWKNGGPYPHFLVLFDQHPEYREYVRAHAELLSQYPHLGVIPEPWLHSTVQGIHHHVTPEQMERLEDAARQELRTMQPFTVQLGPTWPGVTAITVAVYPEDGMAELNKRVRAAASSVAGISLRAPESRFWAHTSLCYARADSDPTTDRKLNRELRGLRPERVEITIDRVHLVSQRQDPQQGIYTWDDDPVELVFGVSA